MRTGMDITADENGLTATERAPGEAVRTPPAPANDATAGERARAAMARYESYIAGYRAWARHFRRLAS